MNEQFDLLTEMYSGGRGFGITRRFGDNGVFSGGGVISNSHNNDNNNVGSSSQSEGIHSEASSEGMNLDLLKEMEIYDDNSEGIQSEGIQSEGIQSEGIQSEAIQSEAIHSEGNHPNQKYNSGHHQHHHIPALNGGLHLADSTGLDHSLTTGISNISNITTPGLATPPVFYNNSASNSTSNNGHAFNTNYDVDNTANSYSSPFFQPKIGDLARSDPKIWSYVTNHSKKGLYKCHHCSISMQTLEQLIDHLDEYNLSLTRPHKCTEQDCVWKFIGLPRRSELRRHLRAIHGISWEEGAKNGAAGYSSVESSPPAPFFSQQQRQQRQHEYKQDLQHEFQQDFQQELSQEFQQDLQQDRLNQHNINQQNQQFERPHSMSSMPSMPSMPSMTSPISPIFSHHNSLPQLPSLELLDPSSIGSINSIGNLNSLISSPDIQSYSGFELSRNIPILKTAAPVFKCQEIPPYCVKMFPRKDSLQRHIKLCHKNPESRFNKSLDKRKRRSKEI